MVPGDSMQRQHTAFAVVAPQSRREHPIACRAEVFALQPAERFVWMRSPRPLQQLDASDEVHVAKGPRGADVAMIVGAATNSVARSNSDSMFCIRHRMSVAAAQDMRHERPPMVQTLMSNRRNDSTWNMKRPPLNQSCLPTPCNMARHAVNIPSATATSQRTGGVNEARDQSTQTRNENAPHDAEAALQRVKSVNDVGMAPKGKSSAAPGHRNYKPMIHRANPKASPALAAAHG
jgi:hypothetical protein